MNMFAVDNSVFEIFDFTLEKGDERTALMDPMSVVLTRENALKLFGSDNVIGKTLKFEWGGEWIDFKITGILSELPYNSHIHFGMLISISSYPNERFNEWRSNYLYTYIMTSEDTNPAILEEKLKSFVSNHLEPFYGDLLSQGLGIHEVLKIHLFPIEDIHLHPSPNWEVGIPGSMTSVYIFSTIASLILIIACINFINLSTASANRRAKEVSLRKTIGASLKQLNLQFIQESYLLTILALILALVLVTLFIPAYNSIFEGKLSSSSLFSFTNIIMLTTITFTVGLFTGVYPAFYLARFSPVSILKGGIQSGTRKSAFRQTMVILQFVISIALIIGTLTIYKQMTYIQSRELGFNKENVLLIPVRSQAIRKNYQNFRNALMANPSILNVAVSSDLPGETFYSNTNFRDPSKPDDPVSTIVLMTDFDFINTYRMDLIAGRDFSIKYLTDTTGTLILNEAAVKRFGWDSDEAIGKELTYFLGSTGKIIGVVQDFNYRSLHTTVEPLAIILNADYFRAISVRFQPGDTQKKLDYVNKQWNETFPGEQFEFSFLDNRLNLLYSNDIKMKNIFIIFSAFSIIVACLGLFGLSVFIASQRTKEIGIRKVLGATVGKVLLLFSKEFIIWILLANLIAWPLAWLMMTKWLQNFAYKVDIGLWIFIISTVVTLFIALVTISYQSIKAAIANPVDSLRYE